MPDYAAVLSVVRGDLADVEGRLADCDAARELLVREREDVVAAIRVLERHAGAPPSLSGAPHRDAARLSERVSAAIVEEGVATRAVLLPRFRREGVKDEAVDSTIRRLIERGVVRRDGRRLFPVPLAAFSDPSDQASGSRPADPGSAGSSAVPGDSAVSGQEIRRAGRPLTKRILAFVEESESGGCPRADLVRHFLAEGATRTQIRKALTALTNDNRLVLGGDAADSFVLPGRESRSASSENA